MSSKDLKTKLNFSEGTVTFISLISKWYKMMNVKSKYAYVLKRDNDQMPWSKDCDTFQILEEICTVVQSCKSLVSRGRTKKLTQSTANAFIETTRSNIDAAKYLLEEHNFTYVLPGSVNSQSVLEKFFGKARMRNSGNFYIDEIDIRAAAKVQCLHQLLKYDIIPKGEEGTSCHLCSSNIHSIDLENLCTLTNTQSLPESTDTMKQKVIYIAGFLSHKHYHQKKDADDADDDHPVNSSFLEELNRGRLRVPSFNMVHLVYSAFKLYENLDSSRRSCTKYFRSLLSYVDSPFSSDSAICKRLSNVIFKAEVLHLSDKENELGCLRRREKLQT